MQAQTKPELSKKNRYWISKHRHYELKHFCLQYPDWKRLYSEIGFYRTSSYSSTRTYTGLKSDSTAHIAEKRQLFLSRIEMIEKVAKETDCDLAIYILKGVTEGLSYNSLRTKMGIPCSRDIYYDRYRRFFWLLDKARD